MHKAIALLRPNLVATLILLAAAAYLLWLAQPWGRSSGMFPRFIGWIAIGLCSVEVLIQLREALVRKVPFTFEKSLLWKQLKAVSWLVLLLVMMFIFGFIVTIPIFIFGFLRLNAELKLWQCAAIAAGALGFVYLIFIQLLEYQLFPGLLFGG